MIGCTNYCPGNVRSRRRIVARWLSSWVGLSISGDDCNIIIFLPFLLLTSIIDYEYSYSVIMLLFGSFFLGFS